MFSRTGKNDAPKYGITPTNAKSVYGYSSLDGSLIATFSSQTAAAKFLSISLTSVFQYIKSGKVSQNKYILRNAPLK